jgi:hypothetical protein
MNRRRFAIDYETDFSNWSRILRVLMSKSWVWMRCRRWTRRAGNLNVSKTSTRPATKNRRQQQQVWYMITTTHDKLFVDDKDTHTEKEEVE